MERFCDKHQIPLAQQRGGKWRCKKCDSEYVTATRKKHRLLLVEEAGGKCEICGYDRYFGALDFHHRDPATKEFGLSGKGQTLSLARKQAEAKKCALLCSNCHREVEAGVTSLTVAPM